MRPSLTEQEVAESRADVCRVAEALFARQGVDGVTMRQIAAELGWSPTTAYRYFKSKEEILAAVRAGAFNRFCDVIEEAAGSGPDPRTCARNVGQAYLGFALKHPDAYRTMFDISHAEVTGSPELAEALARARRCMVAYVAPLVDPASPPGDAQALAQMLWAAAHGLVMLRLSGILSNDAELRRLHEATMSALVRGAHDGRAGRQGTGASKSRRSVSSRRPPRKVP
jgi:AcrR family transcriptional regulator